MGHGCGNQNGGVNLTTRIKQFLPNISPECGKSLPFPKTTRTKLSWFLAILFLSVITVMLLCFQSCSQRACYGLCHIPSLTPVLGHDYHKNNSNIHYSHTSRRFPACIVIGVRKAGTRALLTYLNISPDIVIAPDEIHYFDRASEYYKGVDYYRKQMPYSFKHQITIEKSPSYFIGPLVPERIYRMNSSIKLLLIVRDPVVRLLSDYTQLKEKAISKGKRGVSFEGSVLNDKGHVETSYKPIQTSVYIIHMVRWLEFFPLKQIHIVDGDGLITNPYKEMHDVESFLGLEHRITPDHFFFNGTKGFYCVNNGNLSACLSETKGRRHPDVKPEVLAKLRKFYAKRNEMFFKMVNRTFDWNKH